MLVDSLPSFTNLYKFRSDGSVAYSLKIYRIIIFKVLDTQGFG